MLRDLRALLDRPLDLEGRRALLLAALAAGAAVLVLVALSGSTSSDPARRAKRRVAPAPPPTATPQPTPEPIPVPLGEPIGERPNPELERAARRFAETYLASYYGRQPANQIQAATPRLTRTLADMEPNRALNGHQPRVVAIQADRDRSGYRVAAQIDDGAATGEYTLLVRFTQRPNGRWLATDLFGAE